MSLVIEDLLCFVRNGIFLMLTSVIGYKFMFIWLREERIVLGKSSFYN